ncbi:sensor histidine kinase [Segeticoccus rhizosphaerae]|uniref:sensor histidine kinase n=1 Tax=Segeticoccus rhizosphaerae TaxID=1104777 RepID=UPI0010C0FF25|nr:HAMP domain-containing sensor histidine kinase [Ornithinicoccus soli]
MSARGRIIGWMVLLVAIALAGSIVVTAQVISVRADDIAGDNLSHEADSFHAYAASPTGRSQQSVDALLTRYLEDSVPDSGESYFTLLDDQPDRRSSVEPPARLDTDPGFIKEVAGHAEPVSGWWQSRAGKVRYGVIPARVDGDPQRGALVILQFRDVQAGPLFASVKIFGIVAAVALVFAGVASWLVAGRVLEPVRLMRQTAEQISESDLHRRIPVTGKDDVARLSATFNRMLDRLEGSFDTQRRFIDDAGHELRTPITVVRGHLELMGDDPQERAETTALVLEELDRMKRIVVELIDLARAERPDFLAPGRVDLADLTVDALAHARVLAERHWAVDAVAEGTVVADGQRLTQALMQLASNAVQHTAPGDRIAIGSERYGDRFRLWVSDTGRGVSPADAPHIFERFRRGEGPVRAHGAGLGLSIVKSIAEAHAGTARLVDRPGPGATFVLDLPVAAGDVEVVPDRDDEATGTDQAFSDSPIPDPEARP